MDKDLPFWELLLSDTSQESGVVPTSSDPPGSFSASTTPVSTTQVVSASGDPPAVIASDTTPEDKEYYDESKTAAENLTNILQLMQEDQQAWETNWGTATPTYSVEAPRLWSPLPEYE